MATKQLQDAPTPVPTVTTMTTSVNGSMPEVGDTRLVVIVYGRGQENIISVFADVLGRPHQFASNFSALSGLDRGTVFGIADEDAKTDIRLRDRSLCVAINAHCVNLGMPPDVDLSAQCDYEFLYTESPFYRRDLSRFIAFTLGQISHHEELIRKPRTYLISTTFPDVRTALSNLDILSVGSDAVEIRVDLLKEPLPDGTVRPVPSLSYVAEQVMLLRQQTELPIIFTTRCTKENGKFPMDDPELYYEYLYRAIQWGVEYIDVEIWLPDEIRKRLYDKRGSSKIISAFHDFSGNFKWTSPEAHTIFEDSSRYGDIVKMITIINSESENYELEYFRATIKANHPEGPPLSAVNMGETGQISRAFNTVFSPITHPLLPVIAAPGQMSAAQINHTLSTLGQLPKKSIYTITTVRSTPQATFFEKCFNELGLPHQIITTDRTSRSSIETICSQPGFGGAYINPPLPARTQPTFLNSLTDAARSIGSVDAIISRSTNGNRVLIGDNVTWKGIRNTLTRDYAPSAYCSRAAIILASSTEDALSSIFALRSLNIGKIYTVGFRAQGEIGVGVEPFTSIESVQKVSSPFLIVSALPAEKSHLVQPLLRHFRGRRDSLVAGMGDFMGGVKGKVFIDLAAIGPRKCDPQEVAEKEGWMAYGIADVGAFVTVETLKGLCGQNIPCSFVRLAGGTGIY